MNPIDCTTCSHASEADPVGSSKACVGCRRTDGRFAHHNPIGSATLRAADVPRETCEPLGGEDPMLFHFRKLRGLFTALDVYLDTIGPEPRSVDAELRNLREARNACVATLFDIDVLLADHQATEPPVDIDALLANPQHPKEGE